MIDYNCHLWKTQQSAEENKNLGSVIEINENIDFYSVTVRLTGQQ